MTETSISLLSIFFGILGAILSGALLKKYSLGLTGNAIAGVFGSSLLIKSLGRLGFDPVSIIQGGSVNGWLLLLNLLTATTGGFLAVFFTKKILTKYGQP